MNPEIIGRVLFSSSLPAASVSFGDSMGIISKA